VKTATLKLVAGAIAVGVLLSGPSASADITNFDVSGSIYTKWLYRNNDQGGILSYGNPFWPENFSGDNGVGSEFEWTITGRPSRFVTAEVRLKSRFGSTWHDFFENGNINYPEENTSGETLGMDHAEYIKLRGYSLDIRPPYEWLGNIRVGSTDLGYFDEWTFGRVRYTDRDNAKGVFFSGVILDGNLGYTAGLVALPKLWAGPGWSTGIGDVLLTNPFYTLDYGYGLHLDYYWADPGIEFLLNAVYAHDYEIDVADPDAEGTLYPQCEDELGDPIPGCEQDGAVDLDTRYQAFNGTFTVRAEPFTDVLVDVLGGLSMSRINDDLVANGVALNGGVFPMPYDDTMDYATRGRFEFLEPFGARDFQLQLEYFNIGEDWVSHFGARREGDVLLTDGFLSGGQLPTLNIANEFMDFDEPFYESIVGWHGATLVFGWILGDIKLEGEASAITYNTNSQGRDTENVYPDFLHNQGYTDTEFYDFANVGDRGRDPRAIYAQDQDRLSIISALRGSWVTGLAGLEVEFLLKFISDSDGRDLAIAEDDYQGDLFFSELSLNMPVNDEIDIQLGGAADYWTETNRSGNSATGFQDYTTLRAKGFGGFTFVFGGVRFAYHGEYVMKDQERERDDDRFLGVFRSKATMTVAW